MPVMAHDGLTELKRAAVKRLQDARELLATPPKLFPGRSDADRRHLCGAYYLAGYAVECVLKVYIIYLVDHSKATGNKRVQSWSSAVNHLGRLPEGADLRGANSHRLGRLLLASGLDAQLDRDERAKKLWARCAKWDYAVRYQGGDIPEPLRNRVAVEEFVSACAAIHDWIEHRLMPG